MDTPVRRHPVSYSAGVGIFRLVPKEEAVVLVLNTNSDEVKPVPKAHLTNRDRLSIVEDRGDDVLVSFNQPDGFGTPFGKEEPEDEKNRIVTANRETLEEIGADISDRIIESVSYTEVPNSWGPYSNTVFLVNGCGLVIDRSKILDPLINPRFTKFYALNQLPFLKRLKPGEEETENQRRDIRYHAGLYHAAVRRIFAILLQLDRPLLAELGRPDCDNVDNLVRMIAKRVPYGRFFSRRMIKMFVGLKREDLVVERLCRDTGAISSLSLAKQIAGNLVLSVTDELLERGLEALISRCDASVLTGSDSLYQFLGMRLERRKSRTLTTIDRKVLEAEEEALDRQLVEEATGGDEEEPQDPKDFEQFWLAAEEMQTKRRVVEVEPEPEPEEGGEAMPVTRAPSFVACIGVNRTCKQASGEASFTCAEHVGAVVSMPPRVLIRQHFKAASKFGVVIVDELLRGGVRLVERTRARQDEIELRRMYSSGVRVFGGDDLGPNVAVSMAVDEMVAVGYRLRDLHVLSRDGLAGHQEDLGARTVVFCYEFDPVAASIKVPEAAEMLLAKPFLMGRVWVNLVDASGTQLHSVELSGYQQGRPGLQLRFLNSLWFPEVVVR